MTLKTNNVGENDQISFELQSKRYICSISLDFNFLFICVKIISPFLGIKITQQIQSLLIFPFLGIKITQRIEFASVVA